MLFNPQMNFVYCPKKRVQHLNERKAANAYICFIKYLQISYNIIVLCLVCCVSLCVWVKVHLITSRRISPTLQVWTWAVLHSACWFGWWLRRCRNVCLSVSHSPRRTHTSLPNYVWHKRLRGWVHMSQVVFYCSFWFTETRMLFIRSCRCQMSTC